MIQHLAAVLLAAWLLPCTTHDANAQEEPAFTESFPLDTCRLGPRGINNYYIPLRTGHYLLLAGEETDDEGENVTLTVLIQVLPGCKRVNGVRCAIVREMEWEDDELVEVSYNYFAICKQTRSVFYYGEDVDDYEDGEIVGHGGAWLAGQNGNRPGLIMSGMPLIGSRYYQEIAPGIALDRAEHLDNNATVSTPAGTFTGCLVAAETTPLNPEELSLKSYAPGIGLIHDDVIRLVERGRMRIYWDHMPYGHEDLSEEDED